jgi:hypothetical protein
MTSSRVLCSGGLWRRHRGGPEVRGWIVLPPALALLAAAAARLGWIRLASRLITLEIAHALA